MSLKQAFNTLTRLHSRAANLKRFGSPDIYSPVRITPSNYFRFLEGPASTTIHGREFVIPIDSIKGQHRQLITFKTLPTQGDFILTYDGEDTAEIPFDATATDIQNELRVLVVVPALTNVTVTGDFASGFLVTFIGLQDAPLMLSALGGTPLQDVTNTDVEITIANTDGLAWTPIIQRGDKIVDPLYGSIAIDEIIEIPDIGGNIMGYRVRCE